MSSSQAVSLAMEGYLVKGSSGAVIARMRDRYIMRQSGRKLDVPVDGTSYEHLLRTWLDFEQAMPEACAA